MGANIGLKESSRTKALALLGRALADLTVLSRKTRGFHRNVAGPRFNDQHNFFGEQYEALDGEIDETAERARAPARPRGADPEPAGGRERLRLGRRPGYGRLPDRADGGARKDGVDAPRFRILRKR